MPDDSPAPAPGPAPGADQRPPRATTAAQTTPDNPWPVRLLTAKIAGYIAKMPPVWVEGQVVQVTHRGNSPTVFLTLRDAVVDQSLPISCARRVVDAMPTPLVDGARVVLRAEPSYWTKRGQFSLTATEIRPVGVGELLARIEHLKRVLAAEGLFAAERKKPLPFLPARVGLICGRDSAAEHDVVVNARDRWPGVAFEIRRVAVQGEFAVDEVTTALAELDDNARIDVIVLARGGGSMEDLLPFSNEALIRAVAAATTPVVAAIGHESDTPLVDLVADYRASTPTDAAKRIVPAVEEELAGLGAVRERGRRAITAKVDAEAATVAAVRSRPVLSAPAMVLAPHEARLVDLRRRAASTMSRRVDAAAIEIPHLRARARAMSPVATVDRGYALVADDAGRLVTSATQLHPGDAVLVRLRDGRFSSVVDSVDTD